MHAYLTFLRKIKKNCPETVFHGTDIGHQFDTTGKRYLEYLESIGQSDSEEYQLAKKNMEQGRSWYKKQNFTARENMMVQNFIEAYERIGEQEIVGIYGGVHCDLTGQDAPMAQQLRKRYGDVISSQFVENI